MLKKLLPLLLCLSLVFSLSFTASAERLLIPQKSPKTPAVSEPAAPVVPPAAPAKDADSLLPTPTKQQYSDALYVVVFPIIEKFETLESNISSIGVSESLAFLKDAADVFAEIAKVTPAKGFERVSESSSKISELINEMHSNVKALYRSPADSAKVATYLSGRQFEKIVDDMTKAMEGLENLDLPAPTQDKTFVW